MSMKKLKKQWSEASSDYRKNNPEKVRETQTRYREENPDVVREWQREAQKRYHEKKKDDPEYKEYKYYGILKSTFKKYVLNFASKEELEQFLEAIEKHKKGNVVKLKDLPYETEPVPKNSRSRAYLFIRERVQEKDFEQVQGFIETGLERFKGEA